MLFDELSVSENIFVGQYLYKGLLKTLDWPAMHRRANEILTRLEVQIDPRATLKTLSIAQRHMVAIARALAFDAQVVILDEPTAALSQHEILEFYHIVERLKQDGKAILFISHKFDEIFELADYYTILRDGVYVSSGGDKRHHRRADGVDDGGPGDQPNLPESRLHTRRNGAGGDRSLSSYRVCPYQLPPAQGRNSRFYGLVAPDAPS